MPPEDPSFLSRWSRRKRAADEESAPQPVPDPNVEPVAQPATPEETSEIESLSPEELAALPAIEDLTPGSDIRAFLQKGVPQALRNAALRKMWLLTPAIRDHADPAVDYAWDWNTPGGVPGDGAAPTPERAAQMLRDLVDPRRSAEDENAQQTDMVSESEPASDPALSAAQKSPDPTRNDAISRAPADALQPQEAGAYSQQNQSTIEDDAPRRRHGSALPS